MKKLFLVTIFFTISAAAFPQTHLKGKVVDAQLGIPIPNATVELEHAGTSITNDSGMFEFKKINNRDENIKVTSIGYKLYQAKIVFSEELMLISLEPVQLFLQPIEVKALRAGEKAPFTKTNITKKEIEKTNLGQDLPFILSQTPSVVINSDAGNGVGYTGI